MSDRERKTAFACAVAVLAASAALLAWLWPGPRAARESEPARRPTPAPTAPRSTPTPSASAVVEAPVRPTRRGSAKAPPHPRPDRQPGPREARAFVHALLRYEAGDDRPAVRGAIRRTADLALARTILSERPRVSPGAASPSRGRLVRLTVDPSSTDARAAVAATIDRAGKTSLVLLTVERRRGRWLVTDLD